MNDNVSKLRVLVAMPHLSEGIFRQSVIVMDQGENKDKVGVMVSMEMNCLVTPNDFDYDSNERIEQKVLLFGGPVDGTTLCVLHIANKKILVGKPAEERQLWAIHYADASYDSGLTLAKGLYLTPAQEFFSETCKQSLPAEETLLHLGIGYSGWRAGQLYEEIQEGYWWLAECPPHVVFGCAHDQRWRTTLKYLGVSHSELISSGDHSSSLN